MLYETFRPQKPADLCWSTQKQDEFRKLVFLPLQAPPKVIIIHGRCGTGKTSGVEVMLKYGARNFELEEQLKKQQIRQQQQQQMMTMVPGKGKKGSTAAGSNANTSKKAPTAHETLMQNLAKRYFDVNVIDCIELTTEELTERVRDHTTRNVTFIDVTGVKNNNNNNNTNNNSATQSPPPSSTVVPRDVRPMIPVLVLKNPPAFGDKSSISNNFSSFTKSNNHIAALRELLLKHLMTHHHVLHNQNQQQLQINLSPMIIIILTDHDSHSTKYDLLQRIPSIMLGHQDSKIFHLPPTTDIALKKRVMFILQDKLQFPIKKTFLVAVSTNNNSVKKNQQDHDDYDDQQEVVVSEEIITHLCETAEGDVRHCLLQIEWYILPIRFFLKNNYLPSMKGSQRHQPKICSKNNISKINHGALSRTSSPSSSTSSSSFIRNNFVHSSLANTNNENNNNSQSRQFFTSSPGTNNRIRQREENEDDDVIGNNIQHSSNQNSKKITNKNNLSGVSSSQVAIPTRHLTKKEVEMISLISDDDDSCDFESKTTKIISSPSQKGKQNAKKRTTIKREVIDDDNNDNFLQQDKIVNDDDDEIRSSSDASTIVEDELSRDKFPGEDDDDGGDGHDKKSHQLQQKVENSRDHKKPKEVMSHTSIGDIPLFDDDDDDDDEDDENLSDNFSQRAQQEEFASPFKKFQQNNNQNTSSTTENKKEKTSVRLINNLFRDELASAAHTTGRLLTKKRTAEYAMTRCNVEPSKLLSGYIFENAHWFFPQPQQDDLNLNSNKKQNENKKSKQNDDEVDDDDDQVAMDEQDENDGLLMNMTQQQQHQQFNLNNNNNNSNHNDAHLNSTTSSSICDYAKAANLFSVSDMTMNQEFFSGLSSGNSFSHSRSGAKGRNNNNSQAVAGNRLGSASFLSTGERCLVMFQRQYALLKTRIPTGVRLQMNPPPYFSTPNQWKEGLPPPPPHSNQFFAAVNSGENTHNNNNNMQNNNNNANNNSNSFSSFLIHNELTRLSGLASLIYALQENTSGFLLTRPSSSKSAILDTVPMASFILLENKHLASISVKSSANNIVDRQHGLLLPSSPSSSLAFVSTTTTTSTTTTSSSSSALPKRTLFIDKLRQDQQRQEQEQRKKQERIALLEKASNDLMLTSTALAIFEEEYPKRYVAKRLLQLVFPATATTSTTSTPQLNTRRNGNDDEIIVPSHLLSIFSSSSSGMNQEERIKRCEHIANNIAGGLSNISLRKENSQGGIVLIQNNNNNNSNFSGMQNVNNNNQNINNNNNNNSLLPRETKEEQIMRMKNSRMGVVGVAMSVMDPIVDD